MPIFRDIAPHGTARHKKPISQRVNLLARSKWVIPLASIVKGIGILWAVWALIIGSASAPTTQTFAANPTSQEERKELERQIAELEAQSDQLEGQVASYRKQGATLTNEIKRLDAQIASLNLRLKATRLTLTELGNKIGDTESRIDVLEDDLASNEESLSALLRRMYKDEEKNLVEIFLKNPTLGSFFDDLTRLSSLQANIRIAIAGIKDLRDDLGRQREELLVARSDAETVKAYQETQKKETDSTKKEKNQLLAATKGQESRYQALLAQTKQEAAKIRSRLFELLGGGELTFEQAYNFAKLAGNATGVRPAFILAILDRESALGQNVGRCKYNEIYSVTGKPAMHPTRDTPIFLKIMTALGLDPQSVTVSCPNRDGTYGGAMGPAQFIPSTWNIYAASVANVTGKNPANPWSNADAFVAAGLYLRDSGAATNERKAAARYYCGGNWSRYVCTSVYAQKVLTRAAQFEDDIKTIGE